MLINKSCAIYIPTQKKAGKEKASQLEASADVRSAYSVGCLGRNVPLLLFSLAGVSESDARQHSLHSASGRECDVDRISNFPLRNLWSFTIE